VINYTVTFLNDRIGNSSRKNSPPLTLRARSRSLEVRLDLVCAAVRDRCASLSPTPVDIDCGTHRGTVYVGDRPIATFTIEPPLETNT
jgi:hypothetical protein